MTYPRGWTSWELKDKWLNGHGRALNREALFELTQVFQQHYASHLDLPYTFPTEDGGIRFGWRFTDGTDASLEIDLETLQGYLHVYNVRTGTEEELELSLKNKAGRAALEERLSSRQQPAP